MLVVRHIVKDMYQCAKLFPVDSPKFNLFSLCLRVVSWTWLQLLDDATKTRHLELYISKSFNCAKSV
ncbi:hypothetical protein E2C01_006431 [Portunus trituberculatus]|uniref:Uncharacterized protein n=1 Tax=Portunus trituberculatus TaxID=210409 RepID=A0A5B7CV27_PORTR|nr:hypothetical protein [Portunus trituberculatus]